MVVSLNSREGEGRTRSPPRSAGSASYQSRKVDIRLPGEGNSNSHGARPVC